MMQQSVRNFLSATVLMLPLISLNPKLALADQRDFTLINDSQETINELYVSTVSSNESGDDVLGSGTLSGGKSREITFSVQDAGTCFYDIKVVTAQKETVEQDKVNLCETKDVIFDGSRLTSR